MVHVWCMYGACMVHVWCMYCACTVHVLCMYGACIVLVWSISGILYVTHYLQCVNASDNSDNENALVCASMGCYKYLIECLLQLLGILVWPIIVFIGM